MTKHENPLETPMQVGAAVEVNLQTHEIDVTHELPTIN